MVILHTPYIYSQGKRGMAGAVGVWVLRKAIPRGIMDKKRIGRRQEICMKTEGKQTSGANSGIVRFQYINNKI